MNQDRGMMENGRQQKMKWDKSMWNYKKQKEELRNRLVEQLKLNAPSSVKPILGKPVGTKPTISPLPVPPAGGEYEAMAADIGPIQGDWGEDEDGNPDLTIYRIPAFGTDSGPQVTPFNPFEIDIPEEPGTGVGNEQQPYVIENPPGSGNYFYGPMHDGYHWPMVNLGPKGCEGADCHWEVDMSRGPWNADGSGPIVGGWEIINGNFYGFNPNCMCWTQMIYDPTTNRWSWGSPGHIVCADCDFPDAPFGNNMYDVGEDGHWYQSYPASIANGLLEVPGGDYPWGDNVTNHPFYPWNTSSWPSQFPTCTSPVGCYLHDPDTDTWWHTGHNGSGHDWELVDGPPWG